MNPYPPISPALSDPTKGLSADNYRFLRDYIHLESGILLGEDKDYLLHNRLAPILAQEKLDSLDELCRLLRGASKGKYRRHVVEAITTHETLFFRDMGVFEALGKTILPEIGAHRKPARTIRIWSAACSSGQEPYSLAMLLLEHGFGNWDIQIVATDLSSKILERARTGRFFQIEVNRGLPASLLVKYFQRCEREWQIQESVRRMVSFVPFDLRDDMSVLGKFDIVLCRNVLIYFDVPSRKKILAGISQVLFPGGYLLMGSSETTFSLSGSYSRRCLDKAVFYQNAGVARATSAS